MPVERKLAAILAADVVGSSLLMVSDEEAAVQEFYLRRELIDGLVASHYGRVFGGAGDSLVAEFASAVERCVAPSMCKRRWPGPTPTFPRTAGCSLASG